MLTTTLLLLPHWSNYISGKHDPKANMNLALWKVQIALSPPCWVELTPMLLGALPLLFSKTLRCAVSHTRTVLTQIWLVFNHSKKRPKGKLDQKNKDMTKMQCSHGCLNIYPHCLEDINARPFQQHFESQHLKTPLPPELADIQAQGCLQVNSCAFWLFSCLRP